MIIAISAKISHGKDTVGEMIKELSPAYNWQIKKFAFKLKQTVALLTGVTVEDLENENIKASFLPGQWNKDGKRITYREVLQWVGTDAMRNNVHTNIWVNSLFADYKPFYQEAHQVSGECYPNWIITDCRFPNEAKAVKDNGGYIIRVERPSVGARSDHPSETSLDDYDQFDYRIINDGTLTDLKSKVKELLKDIGVYETN